MAFPATLATLTRILSPKAKSPLRRLVFAAWELSGSDPLRLSEWCLRRLEMNLDEPCDRHYLGQVVGCCHSLVNHEVGPLFKGLSYSQGTLDAKRCEAKREREEAWERKKAELIARDEERRRGPVRQRLEKTVLTTVDPPASAQGGGAGRAPVVTLPRGAAASLLGEVPGRKADGPGPFGTVTSRHLELEPIPLPATTAGC